jgi:hypothetical protein
VTRGVHVGMEIDPCSTSLSKEDMDCLGRTSTVFSRSSASVIELMLTVIPMILHLQHCGPTSIELDALWACVVFPSMVGSCVIRIWLRIWLSLESREF